MLNACKLPLIKENIILSKKDNKGKQMYYAIHIKNA